jgi:hypothetical protein
MVSLIFSHQTPTGCAGLGAELATELTTELAELAELAELRAEKARLAVEELERREQTARRSAAADEGLAA